MGTTKMLYESSLQVRTYNVASLCKNIPNAYNSVTLENIQNHFCKVKHFVFGYLEALQQRKELDEAQK